MVLRKKQIKIKKFLGGIKMQKIREIFKKMFRSEKGYGTVELLILVAALGVLAVGITMSINDKLTDASNANSAVSKVNSTITTLLDQAAGK